MTMCSSSSSSSSLYVVFFLVISLVLAVSAQSSDCGSGSALNSNIPKFTSISVFPNPAKVGQQVHIRTVVTLSSTYKKGTIAGALVMTIQYKDQSFTIPNIPLCTASPSINCDTLTPGDNAISFDYLVPKIPAGQYTVTLRTQFNQTATNLNDGCIQIVVNVEDPSASKDMYKSWIAAELSGVAQFDHEDYLDRSLQEQVQIGPVGPIDATTAYTFPWGTFITLSGSEDLIQPYFNPTGYVWGLNGVMNQITYQGLTREQVYNGTFQVGWVSALSKRTMDIYILNGTFLLTWFITTDADGVVHSSLSGSLSFDDMADLPLGFSNPITIGRLGKVNINTDQEGILQMTGSKNVCMANKNCNTVGASTGGGDALSGWQIGLITGVIVGVALIFVVVIALWKWHRRSKRHEAEDGIFAARRKPEYGNALVVDDIIQETREHSPNIMPPLYVRDAGDLTDSDTDSEDFTRSRSRSRTPSRSRSPSPYSDRGGRGKSPARSRSRSASRSYDSEDYTDDSSASRA